LGSGFTDIVTLAINHLFRGGEIATSQRGIAGGISIRWWLGVAVRTRWILRIPILIISILVISRCIISQDLTGWGRIWLALLIEFHSAIGVIRVLEIAASIICCSGLTTKLGIHIIPMISGLIIAIRIIALGVITRGRITIAIVVILITGRISWIWIIAVVIAGPIGGVCRS